MKIEEQSQEVFKDDLTGQLLDPTLVKAAIRVELEYFEAKGVWERRKREECLRSIGKKNHLRTLGGHQQGRCCHAELPQQVSGQG